MNKIRYIELFGGIGGFGKGLEKDSDRFTCVDYYEKDKYAVKSYNAINNTNYDTTDVTQLDTEQIPDHEVLCAGFPCQSFSVAGQRKGFEDTRGTLFFEIARIAKAKKPEILLLENVRGLLSHDDGKTFATIPDTLGDLGYFVEARLLNSKNWGVPQNRERIFIIGHLGGEPRRQVFPLPRENPEDSEEDGRSIEVVGNTNPSGRGMNGQVYEASEETVAPTVTTNKGEGHKILKVGERYSFGNAGNIYNPAGLCETLSMSQGANRAPHIIQQNQREEVVSKEESGAVHESMSSRQAPKVIDWHGHLDKPPVEREDVPTLRSESHGHQPKIYQLPRGQNTGGMHEDAPTVSANSYHENNFLKEVQPCLTPERVNKRQNGRRMKESEEPMFTLTGQDIHGVAVYDDYNSKIRDSSNTGTVTQNFGSDAVRNGNKLVEETRIRKLTPKECWRLQGFPDWAFERAEEVNSDTQLYKQAGNAVTVNVIEALGNEIVEVFSE